MTLPTTEQLAHLAAVMDAGRIYNPEALVRDALLIRQEADKTVAQLHLDQRKTTAANRTRPKFAPSVPAEFPLETTELGSP